MRKAKIVCTLGPSTDEPGVLEGMILAGMNVARFNFSHGTHLEHLRRIRLLRKLSKRLGRPVAILQDLQGPKIRLGQFQGGQLGVTTDDVVTLTTRPILGAGKLIPVPVRSLPRDVARGDPVLLDDGRVRLEVIRVEGSNVRCRVLVGGVLKDHKGVNLPAAAISVRAVTEKDLEDLAFGQEHDVDYVALSFVRSPEDIERARPHVAKRGTPLIAKIEKPQAVQALARIARVSDGVMIARGDLGVELPMEQLPNIQKNAVELVNDQGGVAIVATEMLESMILNARPTRAEVSDVANAILDGASALMLSAETAAGKYPVQAVQMMARIIEEAEKRGDRRRVRLEDNVENFSAGVAAAAVAASAQLEVKLIVAYTERGFTARMVSQFRPHAHILALTPNPAIIRRLSLLWGVEGRLVGRLASAEAMVRQVRRLCLEQKLAVPGERIIIIAGVPNQAGKTNMMAVHRI